MLRGEIVHILNYCYQNKCVRTLCTILLFFRYLTYLAVDVSEIIWGGILKSSILSVGVLYGKAQRVHQKSKYI